MLWFDLNLCFHGFELFVGLIVDWCVVVGLLPLFGLYVCCVAFGWLCCCLLVVLCCLRLALLLGVFVLWRFGCWCCLLVFDCGFVCYVDFVCLLCFVFGLVDCVCLYVFAGDCVWWVFDLLVSLGLGDVSVLTLTWFDFVLDVLCLI